MLSSNFSIDVINGSFYREFDEYYFQMHPKLQEEAVLRLFLGDSHKIRGLLHFIGINNEP